jgi:hypothetical protein
LQEVHPLWMGNCFSSRCQPHNTHHTFDDLIWGLFGEKLKARFNFRDPSTRIYAISVWLMR